MSFPASESAFEQAAAEFRSLLDREALTGQPRFQLELIFEEIVTNAIRYGYRDRAPGTISVTLTRDGTRAVAVFEDDGAAFDPLVQGDPALPASVDEATPGGLGLLLVRKMAAAADYERTPSGHNKLRVAIDLTPPSDA